MIQIVGKDCQGELATLLVTDDRVDALSDRDAVLEWIKTFVADFSEVLDFATAAIPWATEEWRTYYKNWMED